MAGGGDWQAVLPCPVFCLYRPSGFLKFIAQALLEFRALHGLGGQKFGAGILERQNFPMASAQAFVGIHASHKPDNIAVVQICRRRVRRAADGVEKGMIHGHGRLSSFRANDGIACGLRINTAKRHCKFPPSPRALKTCAQCAWPAGGLRRRKRPTTRPALGKCAKRAPNKPSLFHA